MRATSCNLSYKWLVILIKVNLGWIMQHHRLCLSAQLAKLIGAPSKAITISGQCQIMKLPTTNLDNFMFHERLNKYRTTLQLQF